MSKGEDHHTARGCFTKIFSKAFSNSASSSSTVLPHTRIWKPHFNRQKRPEVSTIRGGGGKLTSNFKLPVTRNSPRIAPSARRRSL